MTSMAVKLWKPLGEPPPDSLVTSREQLHWAVQAVAAVGNTLVKAVPDYSHTSIEWQEAAGMLTGQQANFVRLFRAGVRPDDLTLIVVDKEETPIGELPLKGKTLAGAMDWVGEVIGSYTGQQLTTELERPEYELPPHPVASGATFEAPDKSTLEELARWYSNADALLRQLVERTGGASPVKCWPHRFDIATLITLDEGQPGEAARSIGVGMTPGDGSYAEPYWYVTPWPYPENPELPKLEGGGAWHEEGWIGAVLTGSSLSQGEPEAQGAQVEAFIDSAVAACRGLLDTGD